MKTPAALAGASTGVGFQNGSPQNSTLDDLIAQTRLSEIIPALGGPEVKRARCAAWWRGGKTPTSVSIDDARGLFKDWGSGRGGGVLALIETALSCSRREAVVWLASFHGVELGRADPGEARRRAEQRQAARSYAEQLVKWRDMLILALRDARNLAWDDARQVDRAVTHADPGDDAAWSLLADAHDRRAVGDAIDGYIHSIVALGARELSELRRLLERGASC